MFVCVYPGIVITITVPQYVMNTSSTMTLDWWRPSRDLLAALLQVSYFLDFTRRPNTQRTLSFAGMHMYYLHTNPSRYVFCYLSEFVTNVGFVWEGVLLCTRKWWYNTIQYNTIQEAQLPQRNSASAAHMEGS